ncbi:uncharacterized protein LOC119279206 [Triticum dicoccoides]|uniref:uncharacterized protein LOC119279206 n=1 Tax=Triticum dicoccoides TaxID=85692 RepID=UPI00188EBBB5|nr:uncharacterized protein LOC119279206 [Triticum dicoccoides]
MHPTSLLSILVSLFIFHQRVHAECEPVACGNFTIKYPFWLGAPSRPPPEPSCGHPAFELWCPANTTSASMRGSAIQVLSIDYDASSFVASHSRFAGGTNTSVCRADFNMSSSLALAPFRISPSNMALCLLFDCNGREPRGREYVNATASCDKPIYAYLRRSYDRDTPPSIPTGSCTYTYLPVLGSEATVSTAANYSRLLKAGFNLDWAGTGSEDCPTCIASGGQCRYSNSTAAFGCLCPGDGKLRGSTCAGATPTAQPPWTYQILEISYGDNGTFQVTNLDLLDSTCDVVLCVNSSSGLGLAPFCISAANQELLFLYNCITLHTQPPPPTWAPLKKDAPVQFCRQVLFDFGTLRLRLVVGVSFPTDGRARLLLSPGPPVGGSHHHFHSFSPKTLSPRAHSLPPQPAMDDAIDLDAAAGLATLASSGTAAPAGKGKPLAPCKTAAAAPRKPKKALTPEQRACESAKRKGSRHAVNARDEAAPQQEHGLVQAAVAAANTGSSVFPRMVLPDSPRASACNLIPGFHVYQQASHLSGECSPEAAFRRDQVDIDLDGFPLDHEFPEDYGLEEKDECDIEWQKKLNHRWYGNHSITTSGLPKEITFASISALTSAATTLLLPCLYVLIWHRKGKRLWFLLCKKNSSNTEKNYEAMIVSYGSLAPKRYTYSEVMKITSSRNNQLGKGGYGVVFQGRLYDDRLVAVKFLHDCIGNGDEFVNEVMSIGRTSHVNIVNLFRFCLERSKRALIYEYMPNGSLDKYIYSENPKEILGWERLYAIALGIARGLEYLHHSCNTRIVHFDIKPQNILLDKDFNPKIADFGLAKLCHTKESKLSMTGARGTIGFIAPEVHSRTFGVVSTKSDVYSYGMMLLEMVGGRRNVKSIVAKSSEKYFPDWIYDHFAQDDGLQACEVIGETEEIARKITLIGLWCVQILPAYRPTITKVLEMFERSSDDMDMPPKQNFSGLLESSAHNMDVQSSSSNKSEEISLVN